MNKEELKRNLWIIKGMILTIGNASEFGDLIEEWFSEIEKLLI